MATPRNREEPKEIESNNLSSGLWGKAIAYEDGNQDKARSYYLKERAKQLMQMHQDKLDKANKNSAPVIKLNKEPIIGLVMRIVIFIEVIVCFVMVVGRVSGTDSSLTKSPVNQVNATATQQVTPSINDSAQDMFDRAIGLYKQGRYAEALPLYQNLAEQGNATAQYTLGYMLLKAQGVTRDNVQAGYWTRKAAEQGDAAAQYNMGVMCGIGIGVTKDDSQAAYWLRKAADQGHAFAQTNLGFMYHKGQGVLQDDSQAVYWFRKAAEQGDASGQRNLGVMYGYGQGITQDYNQAENWLRKAAEQGDVAAVSELSKLSQ